MKIKFKITIKPVIVSFISCQLALQSHVIAADTNIAEPIIITATRIEAATNISTTNTTIISKAQIINSTATSLPELLAQEAGIQTRHLYGNNSSRSNIDIRGFGATASTNALILLDGRRLNDIDLAAIDLSSIPMHNIERIEISRGTGSVLYGDGAVGGTINIITKKPGKQGTRGRASLSAGSYDSHEINASMENINGPVAYNLAASTEKSDGYRDNNRYRQDKFQSDIRFTRDNGEVFIKLGADDQSLGLPGERTVDPNIPVNELLADRKGSSNPDDYANRKGYNLTLGVTHFVSSNTEVIVDLGYRNKNEQAFFDDYDFGGLFASYLDTDLATWSFTPRLRSNNALFGTKGKTTLGLDYYDSGYESDRALNPATINQPIHQVDLDQKSMAVYAEHIILPTDKISYTFGARLQHVNTAAKDQFNPAAPGASVFDAQAMDNENNDTEHGLKAGLNYQLDKQINLYANINRSFRMGTVDETFATFPGRFTFLTPQTSVGLDAGFKLKKDKLSLHTGFYVMKLKNEIHFDPVTFSNINLDPTRRYGVELSSQYQASRYLNLNFNLAYTKATFTDGVFAGNTVPLVAEKTATLTALWKLSPMTNFTGTLNYVGEKWFDNDQNNRFEKIPAHTTVDAKLRHRLKDWELAAQVNNLFDKQYFEYGVKSTFTPGRYNAYPLPERNFLISISKAFD